ncbi:MAG: peptidyl-prolyl cis-trans isomerase [Bacteroidota bacterium]
MKKFYALQYPAYRFVLFLFILISCRNTETISEKGKSIARVNEIYLYESDIRNIVPEKTTKQDSIEIVRKYINNWIRETLLFQKAEKNLNEKQKDIDKLLADYRSSLITHAYEQELVSQKLDTIISDEEIEKYYIENKDNFDLIDNIIKVIYVKVRKNAPKVEKVKDWYRSENEKDKTFLLEFCHQYAENFFLDDNVWLLFDDVLKEIPIKLYDKEAFLQNNRHIETQDSLFFYFVNIKGFKIKNSISPLTFEKENIKNILINKRKVELIRKMSDDIYREAIQNKSFEIY